MQFNLSGARRENEEVKKIIKMIFALPLLPQDSIATGLAEIRNMTLGQVSIQAHLNSLIQLCNYINDSWILRKKTFSFIYLFFIFFL